MKKKQTMEKQENITNEAMMGLIETFLKQLDMYDRQDGHYFKLLRAAFPVIGGDPDHFAVAHMLELREGFSQIAKMTTIEVKILDDILAEYERIMKEKEKELI